MRYSDRIAPKARELDRNEQLAMLELKVRTLTDLSMRWIAPLARQRGGILNVASVAAFMPGPHMAVYYASKLMSCRSARRSGAS